MKSFGDRDTERLYNQEVVPKFQAFERVARRKLAQLDAAVVLRDLSAPGNHLEKLKRNREGQHSIRVNDQYRVCFTWESDGAHDVEILDIH